MANKNGIDPVSIRAIYPKKWTVANKHGISFTVVITNKHAVFLSDTKIPGACSIRFAYGPCGGICPSQYDCPIWQYLHFRSLNKGTGIWLHLTGFLIPKSQVGGSSTKTKMTNIYVLDPPKQCQNIATKYMKYVFNHC